MAQHRLGIIMHGVTGRMGTNQHLVRSVLAIRADGGVLLPNGDRVMPDPILVGRNAAKTEALAKAHGVERWTTDLGAALANPGDELFFDSGTTQMRPALLEQAFAAGKHVYCEKPTATTLEEALRVARLAEESGRKHGVVQDKLFLPGLMKLRMLRDSGFFGRMLSVRGEFGYWVFEGDLQPTQRPSWNYRTEDGGGIILDMLCHWRYVLDNIFAPVESLTCLGATHIPARWDEEGKPYKATADDAAYATFQLEGGVVAQINSSWTTRVHRDDLVVFQVDGTHGSAIAGLQFCKIQQRMATPRPVWNPDVKRTENFYDDWQEVPDTQDTMNGFRAQWEMFIRHVAADTPWPYGLMEGAKGVQLAELALESWKECRWLDVEPLSLGCGAGATKALAMPAEAKALRRQTEVELELPTKDGRLEAYRLGEASPYPAKAAGPFNRSAFAAAHVVADPLADHDPWLSAAIDWDATIAHRRHLWGLGFSVAEAMDTAQRGMGLDWPTALELIRRSAAAAKAGGHRMLASGAGTDQLDPAEAKSLDDVMRAYEEQFEAVEAAGSPVILMASRALVRVAKSADDYLKVYDRLLDQAREPVIIHWLGEMFDPALAGYWGSSDIRTAMATALDAIGAHADKVDGIKISLLDAAWEVEMRRQLPAGVRMYTGDDFNFAELIAGDDRGHSDALLGIFDAIAPAASAALTRLAAGDEESFNEILEPTVPLSRLIFAAPTRFYKTGVVFLAWLNGHQDHFTMVGGQESARSITHLADIFRLADQAKLFRDPQLAAERMRALLGVHGIGG